ncbi:MAG: hypothetical protein Q7U74_04130, partial [Saprospiraceae bacterium]|nr:hypothetical protein [Saprospiraceae bacterium]
MKKIVFLCSFFLFSVQASAQFPVPESFAITVKYILEDQWEWCDEHIIQGPTYCNLFSWEALDTANTPATLTGYRIYKDSVFFLSTGQTMADTAGVFMASFYVTATYADPPGESEPSNIVTISDLPFATGEAENSRLIGIGFDLSNQTLFIRGAEYAQHLRVYDMRGMQVVFTAPVAASQRLEGLSAGLYVVVV